MPVLDVISGPWAIEPEKFQQICAVYRRWVSGEKTDFAAFEAAAGKNQAVGEAPYQVIDGVAVVSLSGVLSKKANLITNWSGGTSTELFGQAMAAAAQDTKAHSIIISVDSPGGVADGTQAAVQSIHAARQSKRVIAVADGMMASAAYWIGSAAESVYIVDETTRAGSIGVVYTHEDWSRREDAMGIRMTEITAGRYKRIASEHAPLSQEGRESIQEQVDAIYKVFVDGVAANRGRDVETVLRDMADGKIFIGRKAIEAGLVDGIKTLSETIAMCITPVKTGARAPKLKGVVIMEKVTIYGVECESQEAVDAAVAKEAAKQETALAQAKEQAREAGTQEERARIAAIEAAALPGHEALIAQMKADGTSASEAAQKMLTAEKARLAQINADMTADAPKPAPAAEPPAVSAEPKINSAELAKKAREYVDAEAAHGRTISYAEAVEKVSAKGGQA